MRNAAALSITLLVLSACPSDDEGSDTGADTGNVSMTSPTTTNGMSTTGMTSESMTSESMTSTESGETTAPAESSSTGGSGEPGPPVINGVSWTQDPACAMNTASDVNIVVDVTDPDNDVSELTFSGMILGCTGEVNAAEVTIVCPQVAPYSGTITVADPDGNEDDIDITIEICMDGMAS